MKELSIFIDESGDFGEYDYHSPYYIISMVMHDQDYNIDSELIKLENELSNSEKLFFENERTLKKNYLKPWEQKKM